MTRSTRCNATMLPEPDEQRRRPVARRARGRRGGTARRAPPRRRRRTASTPPRRRGDRSGTGRPGTSRRGTRAARSAPGDEHGPRPRATSRSSDDHGHDREQAREHHDHASSTARPDCRGTGRRRWRRRATRGARLERAAGGRRSPCGAPPSRRGARCPSRCRMVGATSVMFTKPSWLVRRRPSSPGSTPGCAHRARRVNAVLVRVGGVGPTTRTASRCGSTSLEQPTDELVGVAQRVRARSLTPARPTRSASASVGPHEVGALDQHDRASVHDVVEGVEHRSGSSRTPKGARRSGCSRSRSTCPPGTLPVAGHERGHRGPPVRRHPLLGRARVAAVTVGDHRPRDARGRQLVAEEADLGAVELARRWSRSRRRSACTRARRRAGCRCGCGTPRPAESRPKSLVDAEALPDVVGAARPPGRPRRASRSCSPAGSAGRRRW